ncbi:MAG: hypothetical protein BWY57_03268 [Betaproteobacteria bacterium ADurb.Bin341]|nr:MAG: hypothetical protein BWY57_03268 [Betaproteobacteria bacterium ADurb.Bin341]
MPPAMLMNETFEMCEQMTFEGLTSATSSPALADGATPCDSLDGRITDQCGLGLAHANHSAELGSAAAQTTSATCGQTGTASFRSAALQRSLESRLQAAMDLDGSPEFALTWKEQAMPLGQPISRLAASVRRRSGNDSGLSPWATPKASDGEKASALSVRRREAGRQPDNLPGQVRPFLGLTAQDGALHPEVSRWLMGYPTVWSNCAGTETPLFPRWQPCS